MSEETYDIDGSIILFDAGDEVPSWLLDMDPAGPEARPGLMRFNRDVIIFDVDEAYIVLSRSDLDGSDYGASGNLIEVTCGAKLRIFAPAKTVIMPLAIQVIAAKSPPEIDLDDLLKRRSA